MALQTETSGAEHRNKRSLSGVLLPVLLVLAGLSILLYPVVATTWNNMLQTQVAEEYAKLETEAPQEQIDSDLTDALYYNEHRGASDVSDPWTGTDDEASPEYQEYLRQLDTFDAMGRVVIPAAHVNLPVYHGTNHETLQRGVGHLFGTDLPVGGSDRHSVMTAHTGLPNATLFDNLADMSVGDAIYLQAAGQKMKYEVRDIDTVLPHETDSLKREAGQDLITLITCTPYGINSHRLLVHAERVPMDPEDKKHFEDSGFHWQWWMWAILITSIITLLLLCRWIYRTTKKRRTEQ